MTSPVTSVLTKYLYDVLLYDLDLSDDSVELTSDNSIRYTTLDGEVFAITVTHGPLSPEETS